MPDVFETTVRVRYAETDKMGVVYYGNYFVWFEIGRAEMLRSFGYNYRDMEIADDCYFVVAEANCRYRRPARYDDPLRIRTHIAAATKRTVRFGYEIVHERTGEVLATGETLHVICDKNGRPKSLPPHYRRSLGIPEPDPAPAN